MSDEVHEFLERNYQQAMIQVGSNLNPISTLTEIETFGLDVIIKNSERAKGMFTVFLTSLTYKCLFPKQDIRNHQAGMINGYAARGFDTKYITPFLKSKSFPAMSESGWLTRSFEQAVPYDKNYTGKITPESLKPIFLDMLDKIENGADSLAFLSYIIQKLILQRNAHTIDLTKPTALPISGILGLLEKHFNSKYTSEGASRLPVLALYAAYQCLIVELKRFEGKELLPIESHTSSDQRSGRIGDIDVIAVNNRAYEAVEVKFNIPISLQLLQDAFAKFKTTRVERYYLLSTYVSSDDEKAKIEIEIKKIKNAHGCQVIVNGIMPTLKYYLRLLENPAEFIENYVNLLENDKALKFEHKLKWNALNDDLSF